MADVNVTLESSARAPLVEIERAPFEQALVTLIFVAIDATAGGGTVAIALSEVGGNVEIVISGGPPDADPESRAGATDIPQSERLLDSNGLDAARAVARAFGGDIDERMSKSSRAFHLRLPRAR